MLRKPLSWNVRQVCSMISRGSIVFDSPIQRPSNQWDIKSKSLLIHSILTMFMPDIYAIQEKMDTGNVYSIIDGLQRLTTISSFLKDEWALTELDPIKLESNGQKYNISGKTFSELPEEVQEEIKGYTITIKAIEIEENDDEEDIVENIFYRLNNGKPVSRGHLALVSAPRNIQEFVRKTITENPLFTNVAHFANGAIKRSDREMTILQSIMLISGIDYNSISAKDVEKFFVENTITEDILDKVEGLFVDLAEAYKHEHNKFANKLNISAFITLLNNNEDTEKVQAFISHYSKNYKSGDSYRRWCGAGSVKKVNVEGRIKALQEMFDTYSQPTPTVNETPLSSPEKTVNNNVSFFDGEEESKKHIDFIPNNIMNAYAESGSW